MKSTDQNECLSCAWCGPSQDLRNLRIKPQAYPVTMEEKACPNCKCIAVEKIDPRQRSKLL